MLLLCLEPSERDFSLARMRAGCSVAIAREQHRRGECRFGTRGLPKRVQNDADEALAIAGGADGVR